MDSHHKRVGPGAPSSVEWQGHLLSVQPRIRLTRSYDELSHSYLGYSLHVSGTVAGVQTEFWVGIGPAAQAKHRFRYGDLVMGRAQAVGDSRHETVDYYRASGLRILSRPEDAARPDGPPWLGVPPDLPVYRERGHRRLHPRTYESKCTSCMWGCRMPVEIIVDHWNPSRKRYRSETFCYGPKSCTIYRAGPTRKVPGRGGTSWEEEDWVDEEATAHRDVDE